MTGRGRTVDVCLLLEGTYPYVAGGVSSWVHDLLRAHSDLSFRIVSLLAKDEPRQLRYQPPPNVVDVTHVFLQDMPAGPAWIFRQDRFMRAVEPLIATMLTRGGTEPLAALSRLIGLRRGRLGRRVLMDSRAAWEALVRLYDRTMPGSSFLDFFWSWRSLHASIHSVLLADVPPARVYHAVSTGYAGLLGARLAGETGRPLLLTEHGIYTNERRIEIAMADWLHHGGVQALSVEKARRDLRDMWIDAFVAYATTTYQACAEIVTLYGGNQDMQRRDGAPPDRLRVIPNGIDYDRFATVPRQPPEERPPTVAFIGRVVPIKDVKTFLRAIAILRDTVPEVRAEILGPADEDEAYAAECLTMVEHLGLGGTVAFRGRVDLLEHMGRIDVIALTSISEAQPLVILEAGAAGVPTVASDVGACREMLFGRPDERPALGPGGAVTPVANPGATAEALRRLLLDRDWHARCSHAIKERVRRHYNKVEIDRVYRALYDVHIAAPDGAAGRAA